MLILCGQVIYSAKKIVLTGNFLYLQCLSRAESPVGWRRGRHIYIKGVTVRFGFDSVRTSQTLYGLSRTKQRERPVGVLYNPHRCMVFIVSYPLSVSIYLHQRGAFSVARFDNPGNAKAFTLWNE